MQAATGLVRVSAIALAALVLAGCTAQAGAVFQSLLAAPVPVAPPGDSATPAGGTPSPLADPLGTATWFTHAAGYAMQLPPGWRATHIGPSELELLLGALEASDPDLAQSITEVLDSGGLRVSMLGADLSASGPVSALVIVLSQSSRGLRAGQVATRMADGIAHLPGLKGAVARTEDALPAGDSVRFDFTLEHAGTDSLVVRSHLFRFGGSAYLVALAAPEALFPAAVPSFDAILESLRFGV